MTRARFPSDQPDLFDLAPEPAPRRRLYSIAPHAPFLPTLAERVLDGTLLSGWPREGPFWLTDVTIILPTARSRIALAEAFMARGARLLPDIRTLGGEASDEEPFLPMDGPDLPHPVSAAERRLALAGLIDAWARTPHGAAVLAAPPNAAEIIGLADSLGELIDDLAIEGVPFAALRDLPPEALAENWQRVLEFLEIAFSAWPAHLAETGQADAAVVRNLRLRRDADAALQIYGERPVIAAGSTGSIPATAELLRAVTALPRGALVLPGLDASLTPGQHAALLAEENNPHGHPQYGLARLLRRLDAGPGEVQELAQRAAPRTELVRAALGLAADTAQWAQARRQLAPHLDAAAEGVTLIAAATADEEARAVALCAREALGRGETVGIVSPDQALSRRIAAELGRYGIEVDDPAGAPLFLSPALRLVRVALALVEGDVAPVDLIALLRNRATTLGFPRAEVARLTDRIETCLLRGRRLKPGLAGLREALGGQGGEDWRGPRLTEDEVAAVTGLFDRLEAALAPLAAAPPSVSGFAAALVETLAAVSAPSYGDAAPELPGRAELNAWAADLAAHPDRGPALPSRGRDNVLYALLRGQVVRSRDRRRDDIFIWGQLEARLQSPDLMILTGLNEDIWPAPADPGPWLSRGMRLELGLEPPERRQGQGAHDFEMAMGAKQVVLAYAERLGTSPALPSRLVQRLTAFLGDEITRDITDRGRVWTTAARDLDLASAVRRAARPAPRPAAGDRPRELSITEIETLFRSPYDLYAKHTLNLRKLAPLGELPDARDRGSIVHDVFAQFVEQVDGSDPEALAALQRLAAERFGALDSIPERRDIWLHRFTVAARQFLDHEQSRAARVVRRHAEVPGKWVFPTGFTLKGRADRIDILDDGTAEIIDFKTGGLPQPGEMTDFLAPQLPLEAAMLAAGVFEGVAPTTVSALTYVKVSLGPEAFRLYPFRLRDGADVPATADEMLRRLQGHVAALLLSDSLPMAARVLPEPNQRYAGDYDHLARTAEWTINEGDESE